MKRRFLNFSKKYPLGCGEHIQLYYSNFRFFAWSLLTDNCYQRSVTAHVARSHGNRCCEAFFLFCDCMYNRH